MHIFIRSLIFWNSLNIPMICDKFTYPLKKEIKLNRHFLITQVGMTPSEKMREMIRKAIRSAGAYNTQLQREKKSERAAFYDLQTMRIQKPCLASPKYSPSSSSQEAPSYYPVSVLQGQFQYYFKRYTSEELKHMPLNTVVYNPPVPEPLLYSSWKRRELKRRNQPASSQLVRCSLF